MGDAVLAVFDTFMNHLKVTADRINAFGDQTQFLRVAVLEDGVARLGVDTGLPVDNIKLVICLLAAYPLSLVHKLVPTAAARHLYSLVLGIFYVQFM